MTGAERQARYRERLQREAPPAIGLMQAELKQLRKRLNELRDELAGITVTARRAARSTRTGATR